MLRRLLQLMLPTLKQADNRAISIKYADFSRLYVLRFAPSVLLFAQYHVLLSYFLLIKSLLTPCKRFHINNENPWALINARDSGNVYTHTHTVRHMVSLTRDVNIECRFRCPVSSRFHYNPQHRKHLCPWPCMSKLRRQVCPMSGFLSQV